MAYEIRTDVETYRIELSATRARKHRAARVAFTIRNSAGLALAISEPIYSSAMAAHAAAMDVLTFNAGR